MAPEKGPTGMKENELEGEKWTEWLSGPLPRSMANDLAIRLSEERGIPLLRPEENGWSFLSTRSDRAKRWVRRTSAAQGDPRVPVSQAEGVREERRRTNPCGEIRREGGLNASF